MQKLSFHQKYHNDVANNQKTISIFLVPPSYSECISGAVDIICGKINKNADFIGDTKYNPMYTYVQE